MTPIPKRHPQFHLLYIKRSVKDVEMIIYKRFVQFIRPKKAVKKKKKKKKKKTFGGRRFTIYIQLPNNLHKTGGILL